MKPRPAFLFEERESLHLVVEGLLQGFGFANRHIFIAIIAIHKHAAYDETRRVR